MAFKLALKFETLRRDALRVRWHFYRVRWLTRGGCGEKGDLALPIPDPPWIKLPPDLIGAKPLKWRNKMKNKFRILSFNWPKISSSQVHKGGANEKNWGIRWVAPSITKWPGFR